MLKRTHTTHSRAGSQATWEGIPPARRHCHGCGGKLRITRDTLWLETDRGHAWHMQCKLQTLRR